MLFQGPIKNACVNRSPKMDIYRGRVGTSRGGPTPPSGKVPHPTPPGASPPRPLRPGQVAGAQGGARGPVRRQPPVPRSSRGQKKGWASVSWRSSGWRPVWSYHTKGVPRNPGDHHKPCRPGWFCKGGSGLGVGCPERGSNHPPRVFLFFGRGRGPRVKRGMCPSGRMLRVGRQRVQHRRVPEKENEQRGACCLSLFVSGLVPDGAAARRAWGVAVVQTVGGSNLWWKRRGGSGLWGAPSGASYILLLSPFFLPGGKASRGAAQTPRHLQRHRKRASAGGSADCIRA